MHEEGEEQEQWKQIAQFALKWMFAIGTIASLVLYSLWDNIFWAWMVSIGLIGFAVVYTTDEW